MVEKKNKDAGDKARGSAVNERLSFYYSKQNPFGGVKGVRRGFGGPMKHS
jgi:hypothetical protein